MNKLLSLIETVHHHDALNNIFYDQWVSAPLSSSSIKLFAINYLEFTRSFPQTLTQLILNVPNLEARVEYTKILFSELGNGNCEKAHSVLFERFCNDLLLFTNKSKFKSLEKLKNDTPILESTLHLINGEKSLYSGDVYIAVGAQLALESQAYNMISQLYDGARNYISFWPNRSSFHESCEFFYVHIGSTEKEHRLEALSAAEKIIKNEDHLQKAIFGFQEHLNLFANFWKNQITELEKLFS